MKVVKILLFNMFIMIILDIYLVFFSDIENLTETHYSNIYAFLSNIDNVILIILFSLAIINGVLLLINIYKNKE